MAQLWVPVIVLKQRVPFKGIVLNPVEPNTTAPLVEACNVTVWILVPDPTVNVLGVLVTAGTAGVVVTCPVKVPVLTMLAAGQGTVDTKQAKT